MSFDFNNWQNWFQGKSNNQNYNQRSNSQRQYEEPFPGQRRGVVEEFQATGQNLVEQVQKLVRESNVRRVRIKRQGRVILDIPVAAAVVGGVLAPSLAALGAVAAVVTNCTIEVTRDETAPTPPRRPQQTERGYKEDASYR